MPLIAKLVRDIPVDAQIAEWFVNENLIPVVRSGWKKIVLNPVVIAIATALAGDRRRLRAIASHEHLHDFPGADKARRLLTVAASNRSVLLDPIQTDAGALSDLFFMKHRLEHYDVPRGVRGISERSARESLTTMKFAASRKFG